MNLLVGVLVLGLFGVGRYWEPVEGEGERSLSSVGFDKAVQNKTSTKLLQKKNRLNSILVHYSLSRKILTLL